MSQNRFTLGSLDNFYSSCAKNTTCKNNRWKTHCNKNPSSSMCRIFKHCTDGAIPGDTCHNIFYESSGISEPINDLLNTRSKLLQCTSGVSNIRSKLTQCSMRIKNLTNTYNKDLKKLKSESQSAKSSSEIMKKRYLAELQRVNQENENLKNTENVLRARHQDLNKNYETLVKNYNGLEKRYNDHTQNSNLQIEESKEQYNKCRLDLQNKNNRL